jgi:hypothetical protein
LGGIVHQSIGVPAMNWSYVLLCRDDEGTVIESTDVTDEVRFLYMMIEKQEKTLNAYRKELGYPYLITELPH